LRRFVAELLLLIVRVHQILHYGTALKQFDTGIGILDGGNASVRVDRLVRIRLHLGEFEQLVLVREVQLFEEDKDFPGVGTLQRRDKHKPKKGNGLITYRSMSVQNDGLQRHL
jgi:hypothetical protein